MNIKNWFKKKKDSIINGNNLSLYDRKLGEPEYFGSDSLDYDFAVSKYGENDFRYKFINAYTKHVMENYNKVIYNCKVERPDYDSEFLNVYIYLKDLDGDVRGRIDDPSHGFILSFHEVLKTWHLPGITENTSIQFILKDIVKIMKAAPIAKAWHDINKQIGSLFPECARIASWGSCFYVFIHSDKYEQLIENKAKLEGIKKYCYEATKRYDIDNVWKYEEYYILIDNYKTYKEFGQHFFNSDAMNQCLLI